MARHPVERLGGGDVVSGDLRLVDTGGLELVGEFREAARRILRDSDLSIEARETALMKLYDRGKREPSGDMIARALVAEVVWSLEKDDVAELRSTGDRWERAHRSLRGRGYDRCPECLCELSRELDCSRWRQIRAAATAEYEAREGAVR
jgi:hypothetical protein